MTDFTRPVCVIVSVDANCPQDCSQATWQLRANLSDGNGTGIVSVTLREGNGNLNTSSSSVGMTSVTYNASCCSEAVELVMVDGVGNAGICSASINLSSASTTIQPMTAVTSGTANTTVTVTVTVTATTSSAQLCCHLSLWLRLTVMVPLLYLRS